MPAKEEAEVFVPAVPHSSALACLAALARNLTAFSRITDPIRGLLVAAFLACGSYGGWKSIELMPLRFGGPQFGTDTTGKQLLDIPDVSRQLPQMLQRVPLDQPLLVIGPADTWMRDDMGRLADCLLAPRQVAQRTLGLPVTPLSQKPGAILFYHVHPPAGLKVEPLGDSASLAILEKHP